MKKVTFWPLTLGFWLLDFLGCSTAPTYAHHAAGLIIMRHGQAEHNVLHVFNANPNSPKYRAVHLTQVGKAQVQATADLLLGLGIHGKNVSAVYSSPLPRTQETAKIVMNALSIPADRFTLSDAIIESQVGTLEGSSEDPFHKKYGPNNHSYAHEYGGETDEDVTARVSVFLDQILKQCPRDTNILIVSHGTPSAMMLKYLGHEIPEGGLKTAGFVLIPWEEIYSRFPKRCP